MLAWVEDWAGLIFVNFVELCFFSFVELGVF